MNQIKKAGIKEILLWALRQRKRFKVEGHSMLPLLKPDDEVLVRPTKNSSSLHEGDIVVSLHPFNQKTKLIKQIKKIQSDGRIILQGLNQSDSADSRSFGLINAHLIIGKVTSYWQR